MSTHRPLSRTLARRGLATKLTLSLAVAATALQAQEQPVRFPPTGDSPSPAALGPPLESAKPELLPAPWTPKTDAHDALSLPMSTGVSPLGEPGGASQIERGMDGLAEDEVAITPPGQPLTRLPTLDREPALFAPGDEVPSVDGPDLDLPPTTRQFPPPLAPELAPSREIPPGLQTPPASDQEGRRPVSVLVRPAPGLERGAMPPDAAAGVEARSHQHVREGLELAERGAIFSARNRFLRALSILAEARDMAGGGCLHTQMLADARNALQEAEDFAATGNRLPNEINVVHLARVHRSRILQQPTADITPWAARRAYQEFARKKIAGAVGPSPSASLALYGMGKTIALQAKEGPDAELRYLPQAITMHQAALDADPNNFLAANELGVLFARSQRWRDAQRMFQFAVEKKNAAQIWENLAKTHDQLGEPQLAEAARSFALAARETLNPAQPLHLQWTTPEHFAATQAGGPAEHLAPPMAVPANASEGTPPPRTASGNPVHSTASGLRSWLPWVNR